MGARGVKVGTRLGQGVGDVKILPPCSQELVRWGVSREVKSQLATTSLDAQLELLGAPQGALSSPQLLQSGLFMSLGGCGCPRYH